METAINGEIGLLPCPFCGAIPKLARSSDSDEISEGWDVWCGTTGCYLECGADWYETLEGVLTMWNKRAEKGE